MEQKYLESYLSVIGVFLNTLKKPKQTIVYFCRGLKKELMLADGQSKILMQTGNCIIIEVCIIVSERFERLRRKVVLLLCRAVNSAVRCQLERDIYCIGKVTLILS